MKIIREFFNKFFFIIIKVFDLAFLTAIGYYTYEFTKSLDVTKFLITLAIIIGSYLVLTTTSLMLSTYLKYRASEFVDFEKIKQEKLQRRIDLMNAKNAKIKDNFGKEFKSNDWLS